MHYNQIFLSKYLYMNENRLSTFLDKDFFLTNTLKLYAILIVVKLPLIRKCEYV